jgi:hypothetical protein
MGKFKLYPQKMPNHDSPTACAKSGDKKFGFSAATQ